jgi:NAD(P)-dependent dehydrogenase (short-subunit alcohol dehydrogenase family)
MSRSLEGLNAFITGGGTGIGKGIARRFLEEGARVTIAARRGEVLESAAEELAGEILGAEIAVAVCDVTNAAEVDRAIEVATSSQPLDIAVANAGDGPQPVPFLELTESDWRSVLDLNVVGTATTLQSAARAMQSAGGALVAISSGVATHPPRGRAPYSVAKAAVDLLVRSAAIELASLRIRVNAVRPGATITDTMEARARELSEADKAALDRMLDASRESMLVDRFGTPRDIADAVLYLAGPTGAWITGQVLTVDGGSSVPRGADHLLGPRPASRKL